ncbi:MAG: DUF1853 family protein [Pelistega sp.]|nr:DUF1853 family protein [Pelistega sp.]
MSVSMQTIVRNTAQQVWRDIEWLAHSPSLINHLARYPIATFSNTQLQHIHQWLNSTGCLKELAQTTKDRSRLGLYAEDLLRLTLKHSGSIELIAQHFPIQEQLTKGSRTIGELDYIWEDTLTQITYHWELAVKLFLYIPEDSPIQRTHYEWQVEDNALLTNGTDTNQLNYLDRFIGTQKKDTLLRKLLHLQKKQLPLAQHPKVRETLNLDLTQSACFIKGWLFYPLHPQQTHSWQEYAVTLPKDNSWLNPNHRKGWWLMADDFKLRLSIPNQYRWKILPRLQWLSPHQCRIEETYSTEELWDKLQGQWDFFKQHQETPQPLLVSAMSSTDGIYYTEQHRGFVVPTEWIA